MKPYKGRILVEKIYEQPQENGITISTEKVYSGKVKVVDVCKELEKEITVDSKLEVLKEAGIEKEGQKNQIYILENHILAYEAD